MARKTKEAALATREALVDAAERVFRREGVTRTSLAEIAAEAGVTRGAIYWHFKDKGELLDAMCKRTLLPLDAALAGAADVDDPLATLRRLAVDALRQLANDPRTQAVFEILFHKCELVGEVAERSAARSTDRDECLGTVRRLFEAAVAKGQLPPDTDTALATHAMHAYMIGLMHEWVRSPGDYDLASAAESLVDCMVAGLRERAPRARRAGDCSASCGSTLRTPIAGKGVNDGSA